MNEHPSVGLTLNEFKMIKFRCKFPDLISDIIEYLTGFSIKNKLRIEREIRELGGHNESKANGENSLD